ncbi:hypothetical protein [Kordia sp.]|uniref:hypothetical protein n=1 Tax=Kordia sp. TaxID=1965332 RepID=UPI003D6AE12D
MQNKLEELYRANDDIIDLMKLIKSIGWKSIREQSIQRMFYLTKVLYAFVNENSTNPYEDYHFSVSISGPYSDLLNRSILDLKVREAVEESQEGDIKLIDQNYKFSKNENKIEWQKIIVYIIGLYGESKIFSFTINDPLYKEAIETNSQKELNTSPENITVKVLNDFKSAFEETLENVSEISKQEYLELYFEYVFSKIITKK